MPFDAAMFVVQAHKTPSVSETQEVAYATIRNDIRCRWNATRPYPGLRRMCQLFFFDITSRAPGGDATMDSGPKRKYERSVCKEF